MSVHSDRDRSVERSITIGLSGGYTAGHVMPMIALAESWREHYPQDRVICYGSADGIEAELMAQFDLHFHPLPAAPQFGTGFTGLFRAGLSAVRGMLAGRRHLRQYGVDGVVCLGGYAAVGAGLAAASLMKPLVVMEANARPGRANRLLSHFAQLKVAAMSEVQGLASWCDATILPMPLRLPPSSVAAQRSDDRVRLLVTGGTFGSPLLNRELAPLAALLTQRGVVLDIYHQAGEGNQASVQQRYQMAGVDAEVVGFDRAFAARWQWADLAICAAGAGSLSEAAHSGVATLVIPIAAVSDGHQEANARAMARQTGMAWMREQDWECTAVADQLLALQQKPRIAINQRSAAVVESNRRLVEMIRQRMVSHG